MDVAAFQRNFPPDVPIPGRVRALLEFQNRTREWYSGHFELDHWIFGDVALFDGDDNAAGQFIIFGRGPDGSLYAFWMYEGRRPGNPPVVFIGAEKSGNTLLANNFDEFLGLLAFGAEDLGHAVLGERPFKPKEPAPRLQEFRTWLKEQFEIREPYNPMAVVSAARKQHPDFAVWMEKWQPARMFD